MSSSDLKFRAQLYRLGEKLTRQDLDNLTFLCRDVIPVARMERVRSPTDLWQALSEKGHLTKQDLSFLYTLMSSIERVNLLDELLSQGFPLGTIRKDSTYLFLESLLKVSMSLSASEVKDLSYMLQASVQANPDKMFSATQMFQVLIQRQLIGPADVKVLTTGLEAIGRTDTIKYLANYMPLQQPPLGHGNYHGGSAYRHEVTHIDNPDPAHHSNVTYHPESLPSVSSYGNHPSMSDESMAESTDRGPGSVQVSDEGHTRQATIVSSGRVHPLTVDVPSTHSSYSSDIHKVHNNYSNNDVATPNNPTHHPNNAVATPNNPTHHPNNAVATPNNSTHHPNNDVAMPNNPAEYSVATPSNFTHNSTYSSSALATPHTVVPFGFAFNPLEGGPSQQGSDNHLYMLAMKEGKMRQMEEEIAYLQQQLQEQQAVSEHMIQERSGETETFTSNMQKLQELLAAKNQEVASLTEELQRYHAHMGNSQGQGSFSTEDYYHMNKAPHGYCLILNNYEFHHPHDPNKAHPNRGGATIDQSHLIQTFKYLRYDVVVKENLKALEMQDCMWEFAKRDHSNYDSFVCCVLTHGEDNVVHGADSLEVNFQDLAATMKFSPTLRGKPKIFFVQACRGDQEKVGLDIQKDGNPTPAKITATIPQEADFFFGFATPPGNAAYRSRRHGSWFVSQLCEILVNSAYKDNLSSMMKKVNRKVSDAYTKEGYKQCTESVDRLRKMVHFFHFVENV